jgi:hypothetical protein
VSNRVEKYESAAAIQVLCNRDHKILRLFGTESVHLKTVHTQLNWFVPPSISIISTRVLFSHLLLHQHSLRNSVSPISSHSHSTTGPDTVESTERFFQSKIRICGHVQNLFCGAVPSLKLMDVYQMTTISETNSSFTIDSITHLI